MRVFAVGCGWVGIVGAVLWGWRRVRSLVREAAGDDNDMCWRELAAN